MTLSKASITQLMLGLAGRVSAGLSNCCINRTTTALNSCKIVNSIVVRAEHYWMGGRELGNSNDRNFCLEMFYKMTTQYYVLRQ